MEHPSFVAKISHKDGNVSESYVFNQPDERSAWEYFSKMLRNGDFILIVRELSH